LRIRERAGIENRTRLADSLNADQARAEVERIAREVLTNPVIEEFNYKIEA
jgi:phosphoribosylformylglycinamidine synthase